MNREIAFRGKQVDNGEWVYGSLVSLADKYLVAVPTETNNFTTYVSFKVDPSTIGQFTELYDRNGKEIYEGDIINLINEDGDSINVVCEFGTARRKIFQNVVDITGFYFKLSDGSKTFPIVCNYLGEHDLDLFEVIGNIYENPELLEVAQ